jgi:hypothetical protein
MQQESPKTGETLLGGSRVSQPEPDRWGDIDVWVLSSGTWGVYRFDYVLVSIGTIVTI